MQTQQSLEHTIDLCEQAIILAPDYVSVKAELVVTCLHFYKLYKKDPALLSRVESLITDIEALTPDSEKVLLLRSRYLSTVGKMDDAIEVAKNLIQKDPTNDGYYDNLGYIYLINRMPAEAVEMYENALQYEPSILSYHFNVTVQYLLLKDEERLRKSAARALPYYEKRVRLNPDEQTTRTNYAVMLRFAGREEDAMKEMEAILTLPGIDARTYYNCALTFLQTSNKDRGFELLEQAIKMNFSPAKQILKEEMFSHLRSHRSFERLLQLAEEIGSEV